MNTEHFWTSDTDTAILTWIKDKGKDDVLFLDEIYNPLLFFARYIIGIYAWGSDSQYKEDLAQELITVSCVSLLKNFKPEKSHSIMCFVHTVMKNHLHSIHYRKSAKKRDGTTISIEDLTGDDFDDSVSQLDYILFKREGITHTNLHEDKQQEVIEYLKNNVHKKFHKTSLTNALFIIDVIEHPEKHWKKADKLNPNNYTQYIAKSCKISKQRLSQMLIRMNTMIEKYKNDTAKKYYMDRSS